MDAVQQGMGLMFETDIMEVSLIIDSLKVEMRF